MSEIKLCECGCGRPVSLAKRTDARHGAVKGQPLRFVNGHYARKSPNRFEHRPDGTTVIFLEHRSGTKECLIWTKDYEKVRRIHWFAMWVPEARTFYVTKSSGFFQMHNLLLPDCVRVDHKNHIGTDNRIYDPETCTGNLRPATASDNGGNRRKTAGKTSRFKGVNWNKRAGKWQAAIRKNYRRIYLGSFVDEAQAAHTYDIAAVMCFGDFALLNFGAEQSAGEKLS